MSDQSVEAAAVIKTKAPQLSPKIALILGSGLSGVADNLGQAVTLPYQKLPGFHQCTAQGHRGQMTLGMLEQTPIACLQGRAHYYEGAENQTFLTMIRTLKRIGCETLVLTNIAGSLKNDIKPGHIMMITDHINLQGRNPLIGEPDGPYGSRFVAMEDAYSPQLRQKLLHTAKQLDIPLAQGIYIAVLGPSFETPAEIRAFQQLGADAVGMSTVPEVIVARHCGLQVVALSVISNMASGLQQQKLSHEDGLKVAAKSTHDLTRLLRAFVQELQ